MFRRNKPIDLHQKNLEEVERARPPEQSVHHGVRYISGDKHLIQLPIKRSKDELYQQALQSFENYQVRSRP